jgi:hypothetical protein
MRILTPWAGRWWTSVPTTLLPAQSGISITLTMSAIGFIVTIVIDG